MAKEAQSIMNSPKVKRLSPNAILPSRRSSLAAGYDLFSAAEVKVPARGRALVPTDLSIAVPEDTYARIASRFKLALKHSINVGAGVVDADYRGHLGVLLVNHSDLDFDVKPGDSVAQLIIQKIIMQESSSINNFLNVKKLSPNATLLARSSSLAAGYDLSSAAEVKVPARGAALVPTDLSITVPKDTYARIAARSGLALKRSIDVGDGVIDTNHKGHIGVILFNHSDLDFDVKIGDRIAQLIIQMIETREAPSSSSSLTAGYDLSSVAEVKVPARGKALIPIDLSIALPEDTCGRIASRKELELTRLIHAGDGVINADHRGPEGVILFNFSDLDFDVKPGDRVAQLIIEKILTEDFVEADDLDSTVRGSDGFGSTGVSRRN